MAKNYICKKIDTLAKKIRSDLDNPRILKDGKEIKIKYVSIFAHNGTGKTRLSMAFKELGKQDGDRDTLYFNAFTEDLFYWDNDLHNDVDRKLKFNGNSNFFNALKQFSDVESKIRKILHGYVDFDFKINYEECHITFNDGIKISRGEENIFKWCFFLAILEMTLDGDDAYNWVKYIYIDDPVSSLDENNVIAIASRLAQMIKGEFDKKVVISSHHSLFYNVIHNEFKRDKSYNYFLCKSENKEAYLLKDTGDTPHFYHVAMLAKLDRVSQSGKIHTYHFNILRSILEKASTFHGYDSFSVCIKESQNDIDGIIKNRSIQLFSHQGYSVFDPIEMLEDNKKIFRDTIKSLKEFYNFNPKLFKNKK